MVVFLTKDFCIFVLTLTPNWCHSDGVMNKNTVVQERINRVVDRLRSLTFQQLRDFSFGCLLRNCQTGCEAVADEMSRRLRVGLAQQCPYCGSECVAETSHGDGYCDSCETTFDTGHLEPQ